MSTEPADGGPDRQTDRPRLGYLLKRAHLDYADQLGAALAPYRTDGRELAVFAALDERDLLSQQEIAHRLGIDRTTMVGLVDGMERKGFVTRRPHPDDRRKNVVELTPAGRATLADAVRAAADAERRFLAPLGRTGAERFTEALRALLG